MNGLEKWGRIITSITPFNSEEPEKPAAGLYIHVPYCWQKCHYCDFYSVPLCNKGIKQIIVSPDIYLDALSTEISQLPREFVPNTIYIGGGTPTSLNEPELERLLRIVLQHIDPTKISEWTCEANPGTLTEAKIRLLQTYGVNRVSLGIQSFDNARLKWLGRMHTAETALQSYDLLRKRGINNISIDIMFGFPNSSVSTLRSDLKRALALSPEHISSYALSFEKGSPLAIMKDKGLIGELSDDEQADQYDVLRNTLASRGYEQYEISNFARPGYECRHNLIYWSGGDYLGCGPAAHSHWRGERFGNVADLPDYCRACKNGTSQRDFAERLTPEAKARETLILNLRRTAGVEFDVFKSQTGYDCLELCGVQMEDFIKRGLLIKSSHGIALSPKAYFISNTVFSAFI